ncbi:MAG: hypothetical protein DDG59_13720 [Anaerolineae bacterium]|jgi:hypothetical protein|nr:MAG: hypothetical protein DDG59_13720 [Anaerolineae bacterium]
MNQKSKLTLWGILLTCFMVILGNVYFARGQTPQYELYLPLVIKDRGQTIFGVEVSDISEAIANRAQDANVTWIRINGLLWSDVQPTENGGYQWQNVSKMEGYLINAARSKLQTILIIRSTPTWAQKVEGSYCGPIKQEKLSEFAHFMYQVVKRYSAYPYNVLYYELWNEPDIAHNLVPNDSIFGCWGDNNRPDYGGSYYAEMLKVVYPAVKEANPNAQVVLGGLLLDCDPRNVGPGYCSSESARRAPRFIEGVLQNNGANYFDFISFHGYPQYYASYSPIQAEIEFPTWRASGGVVAGKVDYLRSLTNKPLLHTEGGLIYNKNDYIIDPNDEFQRAKADYVVWLYARNISLNIKSTIWFTMNWSGFRNGEMLDKQLNPLPAYHSLSFMTEALNDYKYNQTILPGSGTYGFEFVKGNSKIWIVFSPDKDSRTISLPSGFISARDPIGNTVSPSGGSIIISRPTYLFLGQ